jgi:crotonobetainyl-CoA:carnitine CoA-transferase CaiB-like acyl-CoA transferase
LPHSPHAQPVAPLDGITVVDLTHAISGPTCTNTLHQLGARVIKVEIPERGDVFRHYTEHAGRPLMSIPFAALNAGKESITLNLKEEKGREILHRLLERADVLVENFKPGVLDRLGLGAERQMERHPSLIVASITGFGQTGPLRGQGAYDHIAQAMSGFSMLNSVDGTPQKVGIPIIDSFSGYMAAIGILAALQRRSKTGRGERVDVSMLDSALSLLGTNVAIHSYTGVAPSGLGNRGYRLVATSEFYETRNGWIALGANQQHQIERFFRAIGHPDMLDDPRFANHRARVENYDALKAWLRDFFLDQDAEDIEAVLMAADVPVAMIRDIGQAATHPHVAARGLLAKATLGDTPDQVETAGLGFVLAGTQAGGIVPELGASTDALLQELGYDEADIAAFRRDEVL